MKDRIKIGVVAYCGYKAEEAPRSFLFGDVKIDVVSIVKSWTEESVHERGRRRFFKVKGNDGSIYTLFYDEMKSEWFLAGE